jgi:hypothetical protein
VLLITTLRYTLRVSVLQNADEISNLLNTATQKAHLFILHSYKPFTLFLLSTFTLFVCYKITADRYVSMWGSASIAGVLSIGMGMIVRPVIAHYLTNIELQNRFDKLIEIVCSEKNINNTGTCFMSLTSLLVVFTSYQSVLSWNAYTVLSLSAGFALGASGLLLCLQAYEVVTVPYTSSYSKFAAQSSKVLNNDKFDSLAGSLIAAMLLGTTFCQINAFQGMSMPANTVLLPLALTISGVSISSVASTLATARGWKKDPIVYLTEKMVSALLMILSAYAITQYLLPVSWVCNGIEFTSMQVFYAAQAGIIGGLLTNKVVQGYKKLHRKYFRYLAGKSFRVSLMDSVFHYMLNTVSTLMPVVLIVFSILLSYKLVGLYGIVIAMVAMLANLSTRLTVGK